MNNIIMSENITDPVRDSDISLSLALKYRPKNFKSITGQQHVVSILRQGVQDRSIPQQILFSGGSGLGKTTLARVLAAALLCQKPIMSRDRGDACGECSECTDILDNNKTHNDVIEIDAASNGGKDEIRDLAAKSQLVPSRGALKIYIIDEVHGLSGPGGQAFLKLLEEPPKHVVFMLCTTDPEKMLKTNRGRCLELKMVKPTESELVSNLRRVCDAEGWVVTDEILKDIVLATDLDLGVRGTLMTLGRVSAALLPDRIDSDKLYLLLGLPSKDMINLVFGAVDTGDALTALDKYKKLRDLYSTKSAHQALLAKARERWLDGYSSSSNERLFQDYRSMVETKPDDKNIEITLVKLCRPDTGTIDSQMLKTLIDQNKHYLSDLVTAINSAKTELVALQEAVKLIKTENINITNSQGVKDRPKKTRKAKELSGALTLPLPSNSIESEKKNMSIIVAQIIAAASPTTADFKGFISKCAVNIENDTVYVNVPNTLRSVYSAHEDTINRAINRLGYELKVTL